MKNRIVSLCCLLVALSDVTFAATPVKSTLDVQVTVADFGSISPSHGQVFVPPIPGAPIRFILEITDSITGAPASGVNISITWFDDPATTEADVIAQLTSNPAAPAGLCHPPATIGISGLFADANGRLLLTESVVNDTPGIGTTYCTMLAGDYRFGIDVLSTDGRRGHAVGVLHVVPNPSTLDYIF